MTRPPGHRIVPGMEPKSIEKMLRRACGTQYFSGPEAPFSASYHPGAGRLVIVTGENATGKSLLGKVLQSYVSKALKKDWTFMRIGMERRTAGGVDNALIFGPEYEESTGAISAKCVVAGIRTCRNADYRHVVYLDEPDCGLSESYQTAMGRALAEFAEDMPEMTEVMFVVTHSKRLVGMLSRLDPHFLRLGDGLSLGEWLSEDPADAGGLEALEALVKAGHEREAKVERILKERRLSQ